MNEEIPDEYFDSAIDELYVVLGIKEDVIEYPFVSLVKENKLELCIKKVALQLGLSIKPIITYVSEDYSVNNNDFKSSNLSKTDKYGKGTSSIYAQVSIPSNLPIYGSESLKNYPVKIKLSENSHKRPLTFIAMIAHELSHILLASLRHPKKDNEIYTDLCPILLGFSYIVGIGRKHAENLANGKIRNITYGYFTDDQFQFARHKVANIISKHKSIESDCLTRMDALKKQIKVFGEDIKLFNNLISKLDSYTKMKTRKKDGKRLVEIHSLDYNRDLQIKYSSTQKYVKQVNSYFKKYPYYTMNSYNDCSIYSKRLSEISTDLNNHQLRISNDIKILKRNTNILFRYFTI